MKKALSIFCVILMLGSCQEINRASKPDNLIPKDKMVDVLTELALLHGARSYNKSLMEEKGIMAYPYLAEKFGIDSTQLVQSNDYYAQNYKQYQEIYDRVKARLEILMEEYDSIRKIEEMERDSLLKLSKSDSIIPRKFRDSITPRSDKDLILPAPRSRRQK